MEFTIEQQPIPDHSIIYGHFEPMGGKCIGNTSKFIIDPASPNTRMHEIKEIPFQLRFGGTISLQQLTSMIQELTALRDGILKHRLNEAVGDWCFRDLELDWRDRHSKSL